MVRFHRLASFGVLASFVFSLITAVLPAQAQTAPTDYDPSACVNDTAGKPLSDTCAAMIQAFPRPNVKDIPQDVATITSYSFWKIGPDATDEYDKPDGSVVGQIPKGYNFISATNQSVEGWLQIQGGQWIKKGKSTLSKPSYFNGVTLPDGLKYPFAWVLDKSAIYTSETPGGLPSKNTKRALVRYERVNLYATAKDADGMDWYMIGPNQWVKQTFLAKAQKIAVPDGVSGYWVAVDLYEQTLVAYQGTTPFFATLAATGLPKHDTPEGTFKVWARLAQDNMSGATGAPSAYALQHVPWVMYFNESVSLHGTYWHDLFGYRQSHGCVNLSISDAKYLFDWMQRAPTGTPSAATPDVTDKSTVQYDDKGQPTFFVYVYASGVYGNDVIRH
jgi:hypothetical protein